VSGFSHPVPRLTHTNTTASADGQGNLGTHVAATRYCCDQILPDEPGHGSHSQSFSQALCHEHFIVIKLQTITSNGYERLSACLQYSSEAQKHNKTQPRNAIKRNGYKRLPDCLQYRSQIIHAFLHNSSSLATSSLLCPGASVTLPSHQHRGIPFPSSLIVLIR
jgi:hypothetical protein